MQRMEAIAAGVKIGIATGTALFATGALDDGSVSLRAAVGCGVFVAGCIWWLAKKFQRIDDKLEYMHRRMDGLPCGECDWPENRKRRKQHDTGNDQPD